MTLSIVAGDISVLWRPLFESHPDILLLGMYFVNSGAGATGTKYGQLHLSDSSSNSFCIFGPNLEFTAVSTSLYVRHETASPNVIIGNNTKSETFLQLTLVD